MPVINPAACRDHPHTLNRMYLYVYRPATIFAAQINGGGVDPGYDVQAIPFDNVTTGVIGDVERGYTAWIGSASGLKDYGIIRVRSNGVGAAVDVSEHEIYLYDNAYITVKEEYRLWHVSPFLDVAGPTWYKDCDDVTAPTAITFPAPGAIDDIYQPVPVMGPHSIQWIGEEHGFDWSRSWPIALGATIPLANYTGAFPGAVVTYDTLNTGNAIWATAGARWCTLVVRDTNAVDSEIGKRLYVTLDPDWTDAQAQANGLYVDFRPGPRQGTVDQGGFSMQFTVFVDASEDDFPDEALVIWFFDGGTQDLGGNWPDRTHIKFIGYITKASTHKEPETGNVVFTATTIEGMMKAAPTFPNFMEDEAAPTVWTEAHDLTVQRAAYLHMRWMSSLLEMADVLFVPDADTAIGEHEFPEGFLYDQLNGLVNRDYLYRIGCDPLSTVYFNKDPQFLPRPAAWQPPAGIATIMTIESEDWREEIDLPEPLVLQTSHILASGNAYAAGAVSPLFSHAPGPVPLERGKRDKSLSRLICTTQVAINVLSGLALAQANNDFPDVPLKMDGQYYVGHLFPMEFVELDIQGLSLPGGTVDGTKRDVDLSGEKFIPRRSTLQVVYDSDGAVSQGLVDVNVEKVTYGPVGRTLTYPIEPPPPPGPDDGPGGGDWLPPPPPPPGGAPGDGNLCYLVDYANDEIYRTRNARAAAVDVIYEALAFPGTNPRFITLDSWDCKNSAMVCGDDGVWKTTNLDASPPTWTRVLGPLANNVWINLASSICQQDLWMVVRQHGTGVTVDFSITGGGLGSWANHLITVACNANIHARIEASSHNAQIAWVTWMNTSNNAQATKTINLWAGHATTPIVGQTGRYVANPHHRYLDNANDLVALWAAGATTRLCTDDCCGVCTNGVASQDVWWLGNHTWSLGSWWLLTQAANDKFYIGDDGHTWTDQHTFAVNTRYLWGFPYDPNFFYATQDGVGHPLAISDDRGLTWQNQTGNWGAVQGGNPPEINCCVAIWIE